MHQDASSTVTLKASQHHASSQGHGEFRDHLFRFLDAVHDVVFVDMTAVRYVYSGLINTLIEARVEARRQGSEIVLILDQGGARCMMERCGLHRLFKIVSSKREAFAFDIH